MRPLLLDIYRFTGFCVYPLACLAAPLISALPRRIAYNFFQRLGIYASDSIASTSNPAETTEPVIWVHAASVGEMQAALILVNALQQRFGGYRYILSTTTKQGSQLAESRLPQNTACIMAPLDMPQAVQRAISAIRPALYICLETELWPLLLHTLQARKVPMLLLNGRMSARSLKRYRKIAATIAALLNGFSTIALISQRDRERFAALGVRPERMAVAGNIKFDLPFAEEAAGSIRAAHRARLGLTEQERLLICGSSHGGEEALLVPMFQELAQFVQVMSLVLVLAPRHLERLTEVEALLQAQGLDFEYYSSFKNTVGRTRRAAVVLVDTLGDLADLYSAGDFIFCGGSLLPRLSGHNVMEAARWGRPVYFGPHMKDWRDAADLLVRAGGGFQVEDMAALSTLIRKHAGSAEGYEVACAAARDTAASQRGALARQIEMLHGYLP